MLVRNRFNAIDYLYYFWYFLNAKHCAAYMQRLSPLPANYYPDF